MAEKRAARRRAKRRAVAPSGLRTEEEVREGLKVVRMSLVNVRRTLREPEGVGEDELVQKVVEQIQLIEQYRTLRWVLREGVSELDLEEEGGGCDDEPNDERRPGGFRLSGEGRDL